MPACSARDDVTLVGENAQPKIDTIQSIILPFTTASFRYGTTAFHRPFCNGRALRLRRRRLMGSEAVKPPGDPAAIIAQARFGSALAGALRKFHPCRCPAVGRRVSLQVERGANFARGGHNERPG